MTTIHVSIRALDPLAHGAFSERDTGNVTPFRRERLITHAEMVEVPCVSGNALRGLLRRRVMRDLFERAGISRALWIEQGRGRAWDRLYGALVNGGHAEEADASIKPDEIRALRRALPPLSVLGAALYKGMLPGRARFSFLWPVCVETVQAGMTTAPEGITLHLADDLVGDEGTSFSRHVDRSEQDPAVSGVTPMPTTVETLPVGTILQSVIRFERGTLDLERSAIAYGLGMIEDIGGKGAGGCGRVALTHDGDAGPYREWLEAQSPAALAEVLGALAADLAGGKGKAAAKKPAGRAAPVSEAGAEPDPGALF